MQRFETLHKHQTAAKRGKTQPIRMIQATHILTLQNLPGIGRKTLAAILDSLRAPVSTPDQLLDLLRTASSTNKRIRLPDKQTLHDALTAAENTSERCQQAGYNMIGYFDPHFPRRYKNLPDRPLLLYASGNLSALNAPQAVAIIGTRNPTDYGAQAARHLARSLTESGFVIVSGLAKGCDTAAHQGCLDAGGHTVAILGSGLDCPYPKENRPLAGAIREAGGCLLSEYPPGTQPHRSLLVDRDRLQSGLSQAVIVIETSTSGGSMHTASFALAQQRPLACLSGHPPAYADHPNLQGNYSLLAAGKAVPITEPADIIALLQQLAANKNPLQAAGV